MRDAVASDVLDQFDSTVSGLSGASLYSAAASFVFHNAGRAVLNGVVRQATAKAYAGESSTALDALRMECDTRGWLLPDGCSALGAIVAMTPSDRRGAIITTNFDPLLELSLTRAGLQPEPIALENDGRINPVRTESTRVVHVHGYWRDSDTLHLIPQLGVARPQVEEQVRRLLAGCDVFVIGYGGWDDVVMRTLRSRVAVGGYDDMDVLWSMHRRREDGPAESVLTKLLDYPISVAVYENVDANLVLPSAKRRCEDAVRSRHAPARKAAAAARPSRPSRRSAAMGDVSYAEQLVQVRAAMATGVDVRAALRVANLELEFADRHKDRIAAAQRVLREMNP